MACMQDLSYRFNADVALVCGIYMNEPCNSIDDIKIDLCCDEIPRIL